MNRKSKRIVSCICALLMIITFTCSSVYAESGLNSLKATQSLTESDLAKDVPSPDIATANAIKETNNYYKEKNLAKRDRIKALKDCVIIADDGQGTFSFYPSDEAKNKSKQEYVAEIADITAQGTEYYYAYDFNETAYSDGHVQSSISCNETLDWSLIPPLDTMSYSGSSYSFWNGYTPYNANKIDQSDTFAIGYILVSYGITSSGGGGTWSGGTSSGTLTYPQISNTYHYDHIFSGIQARAYYISSTTVTDITTYLFGTSTVTSSSSDYNLTLH